MLYRKLKHGFTVIELMISMVLGAFVVIGLVQLSGKLMQRTNPVNGFLSFEEVKLSLRAAVDRIDPCGTNLYSSGVRVSLPADFALSAPSGRKHVLADEIRINDLSLLKLPQTDYRLRLVSNERELEPKDFNQDGINEKRFLASFELVDLATGQAMDPPLHIEVPTDENYRTFTCSLNAPNPSPTPPPPCRELEGKDIMFVIDRSSSISDTPDNPELAQLKSATQNLITQINPAVTNSKIGIVSFCANATLNHELSSDSASLTLAAASIQNSTTCPWSSGPTQIGGGAYQGGTNIAEGLRLAQMQLDSGNDRSDQQHPDVIILMTDGAPNVVTWRDPANQAHFLFLGLSALSFVLDSDPANEDGPGWLAVLDTNNAALDSRNKNARIYTIGIGMGETSNAGMWAPDLGPGDPRLPATFDPTPYLAVGGDGGLWFGQETYLRNFVASSTNDYYAVDNYFALGAALDLRQSGSALRDICELD